ncbi:sodium:alanine symporter family protein [Clostridium estertheticum]|uniref:alanine/glycine:cation symporter family protein n=1 Tax=Clostridium estertheticum TaxID=238834 RepID=UPI0013EECE57|nr:sodium:alanine symporter family protein [Clostridium estertheticum]MBZ9608474.1 sodium:alanine symporter family protein [Clostridium estertheticum]
MDFLSIIKGINGVLWGYVLIFLLCGTGIYFTITLKFVQVRKFKDAFKKTFGGVKFGNKAGKDGMSSFQAMTTSIAAQVGTGNLAGAATAIASGGPGAIFWMWLSAFFGMATIFAEAVLGQKYKQTVDGEVTGGPAYYISKGLGSKKLAAFFSVTIIIALGFIGNMVQSNSISAAISSNTNVRIFIGVIVAALAGMIFIGGVGRIAAFTEKVVPFMAIFYILGSLGIIIMNFANLGPAFKMIFVGAFNPKAATGGLIGVGVKEAMRYGIARGLFSNEAGMGSTPHAHAVAKVNHPTEQGLVAIVCVFIDTFIILTLTALVILTTGALDGKTTGIALTQKAFSNGMGSLGGPFVAIALFFFAFSTIVAWYFFGEANVKYLFGKKALTIYRGLVLVFIVLGAALKVDLVWELADTFNGLMVIPNLIALLGLGALVKKTLKNYENDFEKKN